MLSSVTVPRTVSCSVSSGTTRPDGARITIVGGVVSTTMGLGSGFGIGPGSELDIESEDTILKWERSYNKTVRS